MGFVQIIKFKTSDIAAVQEAANAWQVATEGKRKVVRRVLCEDRDNPGHYANLVFFDSYEAAMENSQLPETDALSKKMADLFDGPPSFVNLEVVDDKSLSAP